MPCLGLNIRYPPPSTRCDCTLAGDCAKCQTQRRREQPHRHPNLLNDMLRASRLLVRNWKHLKGCHKLNTATHPCFLEDAVGSPRDDDAVNELISSSPSFEQLTWASMCIMNRDCSRRGPATFAAPAACIVISFACADQLPSTSQVWYSHIYTWSKEGGDHDRLIAA